MRKSNLFLIFLAGVAALFLFTLLDAGLRTHGAREALAERSNLVAELDLTDLALFTEARYTRHPSQADLFSAFQDHPLALDHFPSGSLVPPPHWGSRP